MLKDLAHLRPLTRNVHNQTLETACALLADLGAHEAIEDFLDLQAPGSEKRRGIDVWADPFGAYESSTEEIGEKSLARLRAAEASKKHPPR